jgi:UDP-N-acetylmuramate--alanine ligase
MKIDQLHNVYLIGVGGIGMSALARYFNLMGKQVAGYDKTSTPLTKSLESEAIAVHYEDRIEQIPSWITQSLPEDTLVIYTPAVPPTHTELNWFQDNGFTVQKRSKVLGWITESYTTLAIAGTHGKTTTSSLVAHILNESGHGCNAFLGGITANFNSNLLYSATSDLMVVEADEYDRSFLALSPTLAVITSMDADHLDIYGDPAALVQTYSEFAACTKPEGTVLLHEDLPQIEIAANLMRYGKSPEADYRYTETEIRDGEWKFDIYGNGLTIEDIRFALPGDHNQQNATAAAGLAHLVGLESDQIKIGLETFKGVKRRFEYQIQSAELTFIDDYAHHPSELSATIEAARKRHPGKHLTGIFQPHLFSRTKDFADEFAKSLEKLDSIVLLDIYPAREEPIPGVDSQWLLNKIKSPHKKRIAYSRLLLELREMDLEVVLTLGAGDIDQLISPMKEELLKRTTTQQH